MPRPRIPDNVHLLKGTFQPVRHGNSEEKPQLPEKMPSPPRFLGEEARKEWRRVCRVMKGYGVITEMDRSLLTQYCTLWQKLADSWEGKAGLDGEPILMSASDHAQLRGIGNDLGAGAVARSKIKVTKPKEPPKPEGWSGL